MKHIAIGWLCVLAAASAYCASSAFAAPQYYGTNSCSKTFEPLWNGGQCVTGTYATTGATPAGTTKIKVANKAKAGEEVKITALSGGAPLKTGKTYFVVAPTTTTLSLAETKGGTAIELTEELKSATFQVEKTLAAQKVAFTGGETGTAIALTSEGHAAICQKVTITGDLMGSKGIVKLAEVYRGCRFDSPAGPPCQSKPFQPGATTNEVITDEKLKGELKEASEQEGGALQVAERLESEKAGDPLIKINCGEHSELTANATGAVLTAPGPVMTTAEASKASTAGEILWREKTEIAGCGRAQLLFENGLKPCVFALATVRGAVNFQAPGWKVDAETITYKGAVELVG
jgi:hypothetical protein